MSNLYAALRAGFPADLDRCAIEALDAPNGPLYYSWRDIDRGSAMIANLLQSLEIAPGADGVPPRVAVQVDKSVEALMLYLGVLRAGMVYLPLNNAYQAAEVEYFVSNAEPSVVVCAPRNFGWVSRTAFNAGAQHVFTLGEERDGTLLQRAAAQPHEQAPVARGAGDLAAILYTSGTTGRSKGAMLSHGNLLSNAQVLQDYWDWQPGDVLIHALPIFHVHGLFVASHGALLNGSRMLWLNKFDPRAVIAQLPRATVFMGVPTLYVRLLADAGLTREACARMRLFISGSAPLLIDTFTQWQERTGFTILERYGMSETAMLSSNPCKPADGTRRGGTVGKPLPGTDIRVMDDDGQPRPVNEIGHIQVRGPNVFSGYWRMPEKTKEEFTADGWFKTGDVGKYEPDGYLVIVGRSKDLIISGGYNVYPAEVESFINEIPGVAESAVVGVPHPDFGEAVIAVVIPAAGAQLNATEIIARLKAGIAGFKVPKQVFISPELPRNAMGKVQKNLLREQHRALFA
ncbi:malonate--CoA ligase [Azohydromonas aeria]|uniref:malonate--CoA ligase n=1 Tax=Azohydromonas aeria TaxID=2590212 RepID=UPI0012F8AB7A|nr:malonyl-CoA synthase [Azohydromonas aeria]